MFDLTLCVLVRCAVRRKLIALQAAVQRLRVLDASHALLFVGGPMPVLALCVAVCAVPPRCDVCAACHIAMFVLRTRCNQALPPVAGQPRVLRQWRSTGQQAYASQRTGCLHA
jgi:hypothetical protein